MVLTNGDVIHYTVCLFIENKQIGISFREYLKVFFIFLVGVLVTVILITALRDLKYSAATEINQVKKNVSLNVNEPIMVEDTTTFSKHFFKRISSLVIGRWVGIEGIAAVSSHEDLNVNLLYEGLFRNNIINKQDIYQTISNSDISQNNESFLFRSLPGIIGMLYYSGNYFVVFILMTFFLIFFGIIELIIIKLTGNPIFTSFSGIFTANIFAQFNGLGGLPVIIFELLFLAFLIYILQNFKFKRITNE